MKILVACEESQAVTIELRKLGHEAYSCDIIECSGGHPEWHIQGDALGMISKDCQSFTTMDGCTHTHTKWDMLIAHPPCTYLSNAGACRLYKRIDGKQFIDADRLRNGLDAKEFFMSFYNADIEKIAVENPVPSSIYRLPPYTQIIQPYEHGDPFTKKTCLWLKGLPPLEPTNIVKPLGPYVCGNAEIWKKQAAAGIVYGKEKSAKHRSKTFPGIAKAMAEQWAGQAKEVDSDASDD